MEKGALCAGKYFERGSTKNSHRILAISQRILHSKRSILQSPMPNEHPDVVNNKDSYLAI